MGFAEMPDEVFLIPMLLGIGYAIFVWTVCKTPLADIFPGLASVFGPRTTPVVISSLSFGLGLALAGARYREVDPVGAKVYTVSGWFLMILGAVLFLRRRSKCAADAKHRPDSQHRSDPL